VRVRKLRPTPQRSNSGRQRRTAVLLRSESSAVLAQPTTVRGPFRRQLGARLTVWTIYTSRMAGQCGIRFSPGPSKQGIRGKIFTGQKGGSNDPTSQLAEDLQPRRLTPPPIVAGGDGKSVG